MEFYRYVLDSKEKWGKDYDGEYIRSGFRDVKIVEKIYSAVRETPKGYWIINTENSYFGEKQRWIPKQSRRRYAYPTRKEALESFIKRQEERIRILGIQIGDSRIGLFNAQLKLKEL